MGEVPADQGSAGRNPTIDVFKGGLILSVMVGHLFVAGVLDDPWKWTLYGFHMPLFMAVSGYLLSLDRLRALSAGTAARRYWRRMVLPWAIVFVLYTALTLDGTSARTLARAVLQPHFHLWFIPAVCLYFAVAWATRVRPATLFWGALGIAIAATLVYGIGNHQGPAAGLVLLDVRYFVMSPFFFLGLWLRNGLSLPFPACALAAVLGLGGWIAAYFLHPGWVQAVPYFALNLGAIGLIPRIFGHRAASRPLEVLGFDSLYFYLWHPFFFAVAKATVYRQVPWPAAWLATLAGTLVVLFVGRALIRRSPTLMLLTGVVRDPG